MNLRNEIYELMERALYRSTDASSRDYWTDDILKLFEKRIDKEINMLQELKDISSDAKIKEYDIAIKYFTGFKEFLK